MIFRFVLCHEFPSDFEDVIGRDCLELVDGHVADLVIRIYSDVYRKSKGVSCEKTKKDSKKKIH